MNKTIYLNIKKGHLEMDIARKCINCGLCISVCPVVENLGLMEFMGPRSINIGFTRDPSKYTSKGDIVFKCLACNACYEICPKKIPTAEISIFIKAKLISVQ